MFHSAGLTELPAFAEQWLRKRRFRVISGSFYDSSSKF